MARQIKYGLAVLAVLAVGFYLIYKMTSVAWIYDLPNNYKVRKTNNENVTIGVEIDKDFYTEYQNKKVGIAEYIAEFQYNSQFVGVKALKVKEENVSVLFYLIDTKEQSVYGPYGDEESYLAASGVWSNEGLGNWITTTEVPEGAYFK